MVGLCDLNYLVISDMCYIPFLVCFYVYYASFRESASYSASQLNYLYLLVVFGRQLERGILVIRLSCIFVILRVLLVTPVTSRICMCDRVGVCEKEMSWRRWIVLDFMTVLVMYDW